MAEINKLKEFGKKILANTIGKFDAGDVLNEVLTHFDLDHLIKKEFRDAKIEHDAKTSVESNNVGAKPVADGLPKAKEHGLGEQDVFSAAITRFLRVMAQRDPNHMDEWHNAVSELMYWLSGLNPGQRKRFIIHVASLFRPSYTETNQVNTPKVTAATEKKQMLCFQDKTSKKNFPMSTVLQTAKELTMSVPGKAQNNQPVQTKQVTKTYYEDPRDKKKMIDWVGLEREFVVVEAEIEVEIKSQVKAAAPVVPIVAHHYSDDFLGYFVLLSNEQKDEWLCAYNLDKSGSERLGETIGEFSKKAKVVWDEKISPAVTPMINSATETLRTRNDQREADRQERVAKGWTIRRQQAERVREAQAELEAQEKQAKLEIKEAKAEVKAKEKQATLDLKKQKQAEKDRAKEAKANSKDSDRQNNPAQPTTAAGSQKVSEEESMEDFLRRIKTNKQN